MLIENYEHIEFLIKQALTSLPCANDFNYNVANHNLVQLTYKAVPVIAFVKEAQATWSMRPLTWSGDLAKSASSDDWLMYTQLLDWFIYRNKIAQVAE